MNVPGPGALALKQAIHIARVRAGITSDTQLAQRSGVHYDTLMNWYSGRTIPRAEALRRVADTLGVKYSDLQDAYDLRDPEPPTLVEAIETLIVELRESRKQQAESNDTIMRVLAAMLPDVVRSSNGGRR